MMARASRAQQPQARLTENEGSLLALVLRSQPVTAYQIVKTYEDSPVTSFNVSKGSVYPAIKRLLARGLLAADGVEGDRRNTFTLRCTDAGRQAVKRWVLDVGEEQVVLDDPLRTRLLSLDELSQAEKIEWITEAKSLVAEKMALVGGYNLSVSVPFQHFAYESSMDTLRVKMKWLDELLYEVVGRKASRKKA